MSTVGSDHLPKRPDRPGIGEYATFNKGGRFATHRSHVENITVDVPEGKRCLVLRRGHPRYREKKKIWVFVLTMDEFGHAEDTIEVPWWWLSPRSILDDLAEA